MIIATVDNRQYKVHHAINRGEWFGDTWLLQFGVGHWVVNYLVEGDNLQNCIDAIADSTRSWLIADEDGGTIAGNDCIRVDLDNLFLAQRCAVDYFAPRHPNRY